MAQPSIRAIYRSLPLGLVVLLGAMAAHAEVSPGDAALAEALFQEGKRLMEQKRYAEACPKLAESQRLDPAGGTLLRLALCHELEGRTATAWIELQQAIVLARRDRNNDRINLAQQALDRVTPRLSRLVIRVPAAVASTPGLVVRRGSVELAPAAWGVEVAVDPGEHRVEASAPGRAPFERRVQVGAEADRQEVEIPPLAPALPAASASASAPASAPPPAPSSPPPSIPAAPAKAPRRPTLGYALGGVGLLSLGVGTYFGLRALSGGDDARSLCPRSPCSDREGVDRNEEARRDAWIANAGVGLGLVALGAGAYLVWRRPASTTALRFAPAPGGAVLSGAF